jgi:hypothetical protein
MTVDNKESETNFNPFNIRIFPIAAFISLIIYLFTDMKFALFFGIFVIAIFLIILIITAVVGLLKFGNKIEVEFELNFIELIFFACVLLTITLLHLRPFIFT